MLYLGVFDPTTTSFEQNELAHLRRALSRAPDDNIEVITRRSFALVTVQDSDLGDTAMYTADDENAGIVFGRPYLKAEAKDDAMAVLQAVFEEDHMALARARGSYCGVVFDQRRGIVRLFIDKVGVYPVYIARVGQRVYFSSALRMLRALPGVCAEFEASALLTNLAFGYSIGTKTVYANVERMYGGEVVSFGMGALEVTRSRYWSWDQVKAVPYAPEELQAKVYETFLDAVRIRVQDTPGDLSFLSGGLDSRCIVGALADVGRKLWTLNFAPEGCQDHLFGKLVAEALGAEHYELGLNSGSFPERQRRILENWSQTHPGPVAAGVKSYRVWSGDGGSVGLGHVYLDHKFIELLRGGHLDEACEYFIAKGKNIVPTGMLTAPFKSVAQESPKKSMKDEIASFHCEDPGKSGLLFLLMNDQRLHLSEFFENADLHRFELVLPFFDAKLLELVVSAPLDLFLAHQFYNDWLRQFPPGVHQIPWQAYPGHAPCPISAEQYGPLRYQWKEDWFDAAENKKRFKAAVIRWNGALSQPNLPTFLLNKNRLRLAYWSTRLKIRDYSYVLDAAKKIASLTPS